MKIVALLLAISLAGCQTLASIDARVAQASDKLAARCVELQPLLLAVDLLAPEKVRAAIAEGQSAFERACAKPPRTLADVIALTAEVIRARQAIQAAKNS